MGNQVRNAAQPWQGGAAYDGYMGRWSRRLAPLFLQRLGIAAGQRWLDVGCGTGALCEAILDRQAPRSLMGVDPSEGFVATARARLGNDVRLQRAPAHEIPLPDAAVDATVSLLVLNFVPDATSALREMLRVTADGGHVAACVWDYAGHMDLISLYWEAATQIDPSVQGKGQTESFPLCHPDALQAAFVGAGLQQVAVAGIELPMRFADFDDFWRPYLGGQGPAPAHAMSLGEADRERLRERLRQLIGERFAPQRDGSFVLDTRAWSVHGVVSRTPR